MDKVTQGSSKGFYFTMDTLNAELAQQAEQFNRLQIANSDPAILDESRKRLGEIKRELASLKPGGKNAKKKRACCLKLPRCVIHSSPLAPATEKYRSLVGVAPRERVIMAPERCSVAITSSVL
jgi:hypothetical protein